MRTRALALPLLLLLTGCEPQDPAEGASAESNEEITRYVAPKGAFTCDFDIAASFPMSAVAPTIERDRMYMADRPGFVRKHVPLSIDFSTEPMGLQSGGRYLFETEAQALAYESFVRTRFNLDGTLFLERSSFVDPICFSWQVIGLEDFSDLRSTHTLVRTERFALPHGLQVAQLKGAWPRIREQARQRGLSSVWLLYNKARDVASVVYFAPPASSRGTLDTIGLASLATEVPLGNELQTLGYQRTFDRTSWVLSIWFKFVIGDRGEASLWLNSPPLPEPFCGDSVCELSRAENARSCSQDCLPTCGDRVCQVKQGENTVTCSADCRNFWVSPSRF